MEVKKTCYQAVRTSFWLISYSRDICNKNVSSRDPRHWASKARSVMHRWIQ